MSITLYGASLSPFVRKVRVVLAEKGLPYEHVQIDPNRRPEDYHQISPFGRIPALRDGDKVLADSGVICTYLEAQYPQVPMTYSDPFLKAKVQWFEKFGDYELGPVVTFGVFRNRVVMKLIGKPCDEEQVSRCIHEKLPPLMEYLEANAPEDGFIVGDRFTVADIAIATHFINFNLGGEQLNKARWPKSAAYIERITSRPTVAPMIEKEQGFVNKLLSR
jgi:glutathione S-transferase